MGTYDDSKYRIARKARQCDKCSTSIYVGVRYLAYKPGHRNTVHLCTLCACTVDRGNDQPVFWCKAVDEELARRRASAGASPDG